MSHDVLKDVRTLLEGESQPLSVAEMIERLDGEHDAIAIEHMLDHFQLEGMAGRSPEGLWSWRGTR